MNELKKFWNYFNPLYLIKMNFIIAAAFVAAAVVSAGSAIAAGYARDDAEERRRKQLDSQIKQQQIQSLDDENERKRKLYLTLGEQMAQATTKGTDPFATGTSFLAVREETQRVAQKDIDAIRLLKVNRIGNLSQEKIESRIVGQQARIQGWLTGTSTLLQGAASAGSIRTGTPPVSDAQGNVIQTTSKPGQFNTYGKSNRVLQ